MHRISNVTSATRTGDCAICGPAVRVKPIRNGWRCAWKARQRPYEARRRGNLRQKYDISPQQYDDLCLLQANRCAICGEERALVVDHDHRTGKVRGLLCTSCNLGLGQAERLGLGRIVEYLAAAQLLEDGE